MSYRRRRLVIILIVLAAVLAAVTGSGAFTSVSAQRTAQVAVTGDASALLGLEPHSGPNGAYAQTTNGELEIVIDGTNTPGSGVNLNAETVILDVFNMTNQGTQEIEVWIEKSGNNSNLVTFETATGDQLDNSSAAAQPLGTGDTIEVAITIDTRGASLSPGDLLLDSITIHANSTA